ncbi:MAG: flippase-like domain-containing protein [Prevotella sp.]|nr:flippase-like domain-containing protein [Prevotella sp.]
MKWTKQKVNNLFFFLGVVTVVVMMFTFDVSLVELWNHICHAGYWLIPIVGVWFIIYAINAWAWYCIIRSNKNPDESVSFLRVYRLTITGYALNYATPVGGLGGEPYRIIELSKNISQDHAASSVILYAMMHIFAHFWFWFISIFIYLVLVLIGDLPITTTIAVVLALIFALCLLAFYVFSKGYRNGLVVKTIRWLGKIPGLKGWSRRFLERHTETLRNVDEQIASLHKQNKCSFYESLMLEYFSRIVQSLEIFFMLLLFGVDCGGGPTGLLLTFLHSILILAFTSLFANLIGFLPMQLGVQEGGFVLSIAALGLSAALGIFVSIICRVREIIWIVVGLVLMKIDGRVSDKT